MTDLTNDRKLEHLHAIEQDAEVERQKAYFDQIQLRHRALPEINRADINTQQRFLGKTLSFPLLISSMTGGDSELLTRINRNLAQAAEATGVAMAVGSQRVMFTNTNAAKSFDLRSYAPNTLLLSNLGVVQLNYSMGLTEAQAAIDVLAADGLYLHLNPLQEAIQPEGDTNFFGLQDKIAELVQGLEQPVLLKEVGSGLSPEDIEIGLAAGVRHFDLAGAGGTSWSRIEQGRRQDNSQLGLLFQDWGVPTPLALKLAQPYKNQASLIASGGIRNGLDMVKAIVLGASLCGMAAPFLKPAMESPEAVIAEIERLRLEFSTAMFLLGVDKLSLLQHNSKLLLEENA